MIAVVVSHTTYHYTISYITKKVKVGETLHLLVEERDLYCDALVEDIEYGDGTIWVKYLGDNE